ncbi:hypothetical protein CRUP_009212 [Coryphaenoides rupestris]|nr:hypothetical protein CRUP_009212 [Coryphaenoides rupestris]
MIENTMFEEEPDVVDLAKDSTAFPRFLHWNPDEVVYEPRSSRLLVRGLGENELDEDEEDNESSARLLGMSFMNRTSGHRTSSSPYTRQAPPKSCSRPSTRTTVVCVLFLVIVVSMTMVLYSSLAAHSPRDNSTTPMVPVYPTSTTGETFPWTDLRLPTSVRPVHYDLTVNPDLDNMTFTGRTVITVSVLHSTKRIVLHAAELNVTKATFQLGDGKPVAVNVLEYKPRQQIAIKFAEELNEKQRGVLTLEYSARLSNSYDGFYNSSYIDKDGNKSVLAATQFEPLAARKAFPCFDEPAFKASFLVRISRKEGYISLSNMPKAKTTQLPSGLLLDEFEKSSVNMSTYLVAFVVATFQSVSRNVSNTLVSVYSVPEKTEHTIYALDTACKLLQFYNAYFDIDYPLKKLDLVAIPDFLAGAMENWGLITFRETSLLVNNQSSLLEKQLIASVVAHELAHQWFGNLVTMSWWNDLWLNEGFATYMQYMSLQREYPLLDMGNLFLAVRFRALDKDALNSSHAVSTLADTPEQVSEMFDSISYEKVEVPPQRQDVSEMMNTWTQQKGFPLVTVARQGGQVTLTQEPFLLSTDNKTHASRLGRVSFRQVLNLLKYVVHETDTAPVTEVLSQLNHLYRMLEKRNELDLAANLRAFILEQFGPLMRNQSWGEEQSVSRQELRLALLETACGLDCPDCLQNASDLYKQYANGSTRVPGDLQKVVFSVAARSEEGWAALMDVYAQTTNDAEKRRILRALASTRDTRHIARILIEGLRGGVVQTQELPLIISTVSGGFAGYRLPGTLFPVGSYALQSIVKSTTSQLSTQMHLNQVRNFLGSLKERGSQMRSVQVALETIMLNQRWMNTNLPALRACL